MEMGDADSEMIVSVHDMEAWIDEALGVVDEDPDSCYKLINNPNEHIKQMGLEIKTLRRIFFALNLFIVPVVFSIILCYGTRETLASTNSRLEAGFETLVTLLMFLSGCVGFPFYIYSLWVSYQFSERMRDEYHNLRFPSLEDVSSNLDDVPMTEESALLLCLTDSSLERLNEFARLLSSRMPARMKNDLERRRSSRVLNRGVENSALETSELEMILSKEGSANTTEKFLAEKEDHTNSDTMEEYRSEGDYPSIHFQVYMNDSGQDLSIKVASVGREGRRLENDDGRKRSLENSVKKAPSSDNIKEDCLSAQPIKENATPFDVAIKDIVF